MRREEYLKILSSLTESMTLDVDVDSDFNTKSQEEIIKRDLKYSELLEHFVDTTIQRNKNKEDYKWWYFKIIMALLIALNVVIFITIVVLLLRCNAEQIVSTAPVFITAIAGFASSIIAIPLSITKYLFSTKEDKYITDIISHTQEHDLSSRRILKTITEIADPDKASRLSL